MPLDCDTDLGKVFIDEQYRTQDRLEKAGYVVLNMASKHSRSDVILARKIGERYITYGVAEIKSRISAADKPITVEWLRENGGYLITADKLKAGRILSTELGVPFYIIVSIVRDNKILIWKITHSDGSWTEEHEKRVTKTRATVNGGVATRTNAFLSMDSKFLTILE